MAEPPWRVAAVTEQTWSLHQKQAHRVERTRTLLGRQKVEVVTWDHHQTPGAQGRCIVPMTMTAFSTKTAPSPSPGMLVVQLFPRTVDVGSHLCPTQLLLLKITTPPSLYDVPVHTCKIHIISMLLQAQNISEMLASGEGDGGF